MNRIDTSHVVDPTLLQPFTANSLDFVQDTISFVSIALCKHIIQTNNLVYSASTPYRLYIVSGSDYVFFNDELYLMSNPGGSTNIAVLTTIYPAYDPTLFSDGFTSFNVHAERFLVQTNGTLGTGLFDLADIVEVRLGDINYTGVTANTNWTVPNPYAAVPNVCEFKKTSTNEVVFRGMIKNTNTGVTQTAFTLPVGYRPTQKKYLQAYSDYLATTVSVFININGVVAITGISTNNVAVSLDGIRFTLD